MSETIAPLQLASAAAFAVTRTMIGGDDDERLVVHPDFAQPHDQITEQTVHEPDLRQMSLMEGIGVRSAHSLEQPLSPEYVGLIVRTAVPPSRRDVFERHVRQHQVKEVQSCRLTVNRRQELRERAASAVSDFWSSSHVSERIPPNRRSQAAVPL